MIYTLQILCLLITLISLSNPISTQYKIYAVEFERVTYPRIIDPEKLIQLPPHLVRKVNEEENKFSKVKYIYLLTSNGRKSKYIFKDVEKPPDMNFSFGTIDHYKDFASCKVISLSASLPPDTQIEGVLMGPEEWTLFEGVDTVICSYRSKKALSREGAIAWYTEQIPIPDGPSTFSGLPGLILKVVVPGKYVITARKVAVASDTVTIDIPHRPKAISMEKYVGSLSKTLLQRKR